ncbi:MAG TPA: hypothetical protein VN634_05135 [Candidatus Limnocylindrales bacterium]|nr:hypothetical protein [Candidatus Limnocylindrales bacterium]
MLDVAVGQAVCPPSVCDVDSSGAITAGDALRVLRRAVGLEVTLVCPPIARIACSSGEIHLGEGSTLDLGYGRKTQFDLASALPIDFRIARRCSTDAAPCTSDDDCGNGTCVATCDCVVDTTCEIIGPTGRGHCLESFDECASNSDCEDDEPCVALVAPPVGAAFENSLFCMTLWLDEGLHGTLDTQSGAMDLDGRLLATLYYGVGGGQACPRCGKPSDNPTIGDTFVCEGGTKDGEPCAVEAVNEIFGGASTDCPTGDEDEITPTPIAVPLRGLTTGATSRTALLPCAATGFDNPLKGDATCTDNQSACTSNADCRRCSEEPSIACSSNSDCDGHGACATAPDQPVTCGYWCHCGYCDDDPDQPCFESSECADGATCEVGTGLLQAANRPQQLPNQCSEDQFICGLSAAEECSQSVAGHCSLAPERPCTAESTICADNDAGSCVVGPEKCYESRIEREGSPSPYGAYCRIARNPCTTNVDCGSADDTCAYSALAPNLEALVCASGTRSGFLDAGITIPGPGTADLRAFVTICGCGDGVIGCDEMCDDGNSVNGDGCDENCQDAPVTARKDPRP